MVKRIFAATILLLSAVAASSGELYPEESIYRLQARITGQSGQELGLDAHRGHPVLVSMFYSSCSMTCPLIIDTVRAIENAALSRRRELRVLMISIDPARDTVQRLHDLTVTRKIDDTRWTVARASESDVRRIAAVLNVQYRRLPSGDFNHSSTVTLLSPEGEILAQSDRLGTADPKLVHALLNTTK
jgi:protein SCO1/2